VREQQGPTFEARVHLTEPLGDITLIDLEANDTPIRMVLPESEALQYQPGDALKVELAMAGAHLFFRDTGTRIE
jgi:multiple sugar transport system ATP-binding protein